MKCLRRDARSSRPARTAAVPFLLALMLAIPVVRGQTSHSNDYEAMGLDPQPLLIELIGLQFHPPAKAHRQVRWTGDTVTATVVDGANQPPAWSMRVQLLSSTLQRPSPRAQIDQLIASWRADGRSFEILDNHAVTYAGRDGRLCFLHQQIEGGEDVVTGWLILPYAEEVFLVFTIQALPDELDRLRTLLARSFDTIFFRRVDDVVEQRREHLQRGEAFLERITPEDLKALAGVEEFLRYYRPAEATDDGRPREIGFARVEFVDGKRGMLNPARAPASYDTAEHEPGLLVRVYARMVENAERGIYRDAEMLFWLAWDQSAEGWSIRMTRRQGDAEQSESETGIRTPRSPSDPRGTLTVIEMGKDGGTREPQSWHVPDVYMSQALKWALGRLLPRDTDEPREYRYYFYDSATKKLSLRQDRWQPIIGRSQQFKLTSQARTDAPEVTSIFDGAGNLIRRTWPDGSLSEPITVEKLSQIWRSRGLETGRISR